MRAQRGERLYWVACTIASLLAVVGVYCIIYHTVVSVVHTFLLFGVPAALIWFLGLQAPRLFPDE
jgi:uncharacterized membrane protein